MLDDDEIHRAIIEKEADKSIQDQFVIQHCNNFISFLTNSVKKLHYNKNEIF